MTDIGEMAGRAVAAGAGGFMVGGPAGALVAVAASVVPEIVRAIAGDGAGTAVAAVADAVQAVTGTSDPVAAAGTLAADPSKALELRTRLLEIQVRAEAERRRDELEALRMSDADRQASRASMLQLVAEKHALAWMPAYQTIIVGMAFIGSLIALFAITIYGSADLKPGIREVLVMVLGILAGEFRGACQFWIGGSRAGSQAAQATTQQALAAFPAPTPPPSVTRPAPPDAPPPARRSIFARGQG